ncbi:MAG TPA: FAD-dependent tricarballylate dehydrogenase TcuA [Xanthobacteraceae bacterium]|nr:FAD-dependent tricarballylate dehydrogenase TcuA [Xanthobacteraceae bacterium]
MAGKPWDVVVVGAGNAAFCAALAAREKGASVLMLERAPKELMGGNSRFTAGAFRCVYDGVEDLKAIMPELTAEEIARSDFGTYTADQFFDDMFRVTQYRTDGELCERLVNRSREAMRWLHSKGMKFAPIWGRQAYNIGGKFKFWGGLTVEAWGGGPGLIEQHLKIAHKHGIDIRYATRALSLIYDGHVVRGVKVKANGALDEIRCKSVVLACGGFESNVEWRTRYLGPGWELAKVRGTAFNTGDGIRMALDIGAQPYGNWSGSHAVQWDYNAPEFGDLSVGDNFQKHSYPWGIMINAHGRRFVDEGADFRNYTYAKYGAIVLRQPNNFAYQVFDKKIIPMLRDEYRIKRVSKVTANSLEELAQKMEGVDAAGFLDEIKKYNAAVRTDIPFNPNIKDGRCTVGLPINKSNWANTIDEPPFEAYQVGCGISFTFGGLRIDPDTGQVIDSDQAPIPGLYAAGELVGGIFYFNYPGGTGLMSGTVFGRIAGTGAATARNA